MLLAQTVNSPDVQAPLYIDILENILLHKEVSGKENVDKAIRQATNIALKREDVYSIDHKHFFFITTLLKRYEEGLKNLDNLEITSRTYSEIISVFR